MGSSLAQWNLISGFLLPPILQLIKQQGWSTQLKAVFAFLACCLVAIGTVYWKGDLDFVDWLGSMLLILVTALSTYELMWKKAAPAVMEKLGQFPKAKGA